MLWQISLPRRTVILAVCLSVLIVGAGLLSWYLLTRPPVPPQASCGTIVFPTVRAPGQQTQQIEHCFAQAYQRCAAINMQVDQYGTDTSSTTFYWPQQQGQACKIIAQTNSSSPVRSDFTTTETCQAVLARTGGLLFQKCSTSGDVLIGGS